MTNHILPHSARTAPIDNTRAGINDSIVRGVHTSTMEFLLGFFTLLCIFAAHIFMLGILRIWQQMYFVTLLGTPINNIKNYFVTFLFHLLSPFRYFLTWMLDRQCLLWLKATSVILPWRGRLPTKLIFVAAFSTFSLLSLSFDWAAVPMRSPRQAEEDWSRHGDRHPRQLVHSQ